MTSEFRGILEDASAVLVDFDGPLAALMPPPANTRAADAARAVLAGMELPNDILATTDHLAVLRWSLEHAPAPLMLEVEAACTQAELSAAADCLESVNCPVLLEYARRTGLPVAVVSNNGAVAVESFLRRKGWMDYVEAISARTPETVGLLKPKPDLLLLAAHVLRVDIGSAVFVGDAVSDVVAARRAGCKVVGLYKDDVRMRELDQAGADLLGDLSTAVIA